MVKPPSGHSVFRYSPILIVLLWFRGPISTWRRAEHAEALTLYVSVNQLPDYADKIKTDSQHFAATVISKRGADIDYQPSEDFKPAEGKVNILRLTRIPESRLNN